MRLKKYIVAANEKDLIEFRFEKIGEYTYRFKKQLYCKDKKILIFADVILSLKEKSVVINVLDTNANCTAYTPFYIKPSYPNLVLNKVMVNYKKFIDNLVESGIVRKED